MGTEMMMKHSPELERAAPFIIPNTITMWGETRSAILKKMIWETIGYPNSAQTLY